MKEQFDKKLVEKIKDSFSVHEEPFNPKQWEKLSSAYFKPRKSVWQIYWPLITTGIAASLFLVLFYNPFAVDRKAPESLVSEARNSTGREKPQETLQNLDSPIALSEQDPSMSAKDDRITSAPKVDSYRKEVKGNVSSAHEGVLNPELTQRENIPLLDQHFQIELPLDEINERVAEALDPVTSNASQPTMGQSEALERVNEWLAESGNNDPVVRKKDRDGPLKLGVMVSPQASSNATGGMNLGAGVMSEFSLTKRLKLDFGVNYARQSMMPDRPSSMSLEMSSYASPVQNKDMMNIRTSNNFIGSELQLNFASLDIPVNLKYRVMDKKNTGLYLITGLSSIVYLDQQATETFQTNSFFTNSAEGLSFAPSVQNFTSVYSPDGANNSVDVGGMLNLSVGYEYNLNDGMFISLEPFYKLPLGNLTFANQQFSIGGLNLRMNFNLGK